MDSAVELNRDQAIELAKAAADYASEVAGRASEYLSKFAAPGEARWTDAGDGIDSLRHALRAVEAIEQMNPGRGEVGSLDQWGA